MSFIRRPWVAMWQVVECGTCGAVVKRFPCRKRRCMSVWTERWPLRAGCAFQRAGHRGITLGGPLSLIALTVIDQAFTVCPMDAINGRIQRCVHVRLCLGCYLIFVFRHGDFHWTAISVWVRSTWFDFMFLLNMEAAPCPPCLHSLSCLPPIDITRSKNNSKFHQIAERDEMCSHLLCQLLIVTCKNHK